ncbi:NosD domain-containing protein [Methanospirillum lacunae]|nr:NosD domain-containing protein [Methanospirillum lacunae]
MMKDYVQTDDKTGYCGGFIFVLVLGSFLLSSGVAIVSADGLSNHTALVPGYNGTNYTFLGSYSSGEVIINESGSYYLTDDLNSSPYEYGILIQGTGITLDGNGKNLTGSSEIGIMGKEGSHHTTIINFSKISDFYYGMRLDGNNSLVNGNTVSDNGYTGIYVGGAYGTIVNNTAYLNSNGIYSTPHYGRNCVIMNNTAFLNKRMGIYTGGDSSLVYGNRAFRNNVYGIMAGGGDCGGIDPRDCGYGYYSNISGNVAYENGMYGIYSCEPSARVIGNTIYDNYQAGIMIRSRLNNSVSDNLLTNNTIGIRTTYSNQYNVTMTGNIIRESVKAGILVDGTYTKPGNFTIYNNILANNQNIFMNDSTRCFTWNHPTGPVSGINVIGGPYLAGNYWSNPEGSGWSDLQDPKETGYSLVPYEVVDGSGSWDTAPLVRVAQIINASHDDWTILHPNGNQSYPRYSNSNLHCPGKTGG